MKIENFINRVSIHSSSTIKKQNKITQMINDSMKLDSLQISENAKMSRLYIKIINIVQ